MTAAADAAAREILDRPYVGLTFYEEEHAALFFGRETERKTILGNLRSSRLTLLYAESGVGKSSLLRAGIAARVRELAQRSAQEGNPPRHVPVVFSAWRDDPVAGLVGAVAEAVAPFCPGGTAPELPRDDLGEALGRAAKAARTTLLVILDQFEDYFLYHSEDAGRSFAQQLAQCVKSPELPANFLISIREDAYFRLGDRFQGLIPNVYGNFVHLEHLDARAAREAITKPIDLFNTLQNGGEPYRIEEGLVDAVLEQVRRGAVAIGDGGQGTVDGQRNGGSAELIETPYLQLVMRRLWDEEVAGGSRVLRLETLERLHGAQTIIRTHLDKALGGLEPGEQEVAAAVFRYLVTPSGTKIALGVRDLAQFAEVPEGQLEDVLAKLSGSGTRILRPVAAPNQPDEPRYEIFHDVLGGAVLDWRARRVAKAAEARAERERRKALISYGVALACLLVAAGVGVLAWWANGQRQAARSERYRAQAVAALGVDPQQSVFLAQKAVKTKDTRDDESTLRVAAAASRVRGVYAESTPLYNAEYNHSGSLAVMLADKRAPVVDPRSGRTVTVLRSGATLANARFGPTGDLVVTGDWDGRVRVWDPHRSTPVFARKLGVLVSDVALSGGTRRVLAIDWNGVVHVWPVAGGAARPIRLKAGGSHSIALAVFSPDGGVVATGDDAGRVQLWNPATGKRLHSLLGHRGAIDTISFDKTGRRLITGDAAGRRSTVRIWSVATGREIGPPLHESDDIIAAVFSPDGKRVATAARKVAHIWRVGSATPMSELRGHTDWLNDVQFRPRDGALVATASQDGTARVWEAATGESLLELRGHRGIVNTVGFSPHGDSLLTSSLDGTARVWDIGTGHELRGHTDWVLDASFSPDGKRILTAGADHQVRLWSAASGEELGHLHLPSARPLNSVEFSPNGKRLVTAGDDGEAVIRSAAGGDRLATIDEGDEAGLYGRDEAALIQASFSPDGKRVVTASVDWYARIWNAKNGKLIKTLKKPHDRFGDVAHDGAVHTAAYSPDGRFVVTGGEDRKARVWNARTGRYLRSFDAHRGNVLRVDFDRRDPRLAVTASDDGTARVWDVTTAKQIAELEVQGERVTDAAFSPDGELVTTAGAGGTVRVWRWRSEELVAVLKMHADYVNSVEFSPNGQWLLSASDDRTAKFYRCSTCGSIKSVQRELRRRERLLGRYPGS